MLTSLLIEQRVAYRKKGHPLDHDAYLTQQFAKAKRENSPYIFKNQFYSFKFFTVTWFCIVQGSPCGPPPQEVRPVDLEDVKIQA